MRQLFGLIVFLFATHANSSMLENYFNSCAGELMHNPSAYKIVLNKLELRTARSDDLEMVRRLFQDIDVQRRYLIRTEWNDAASERYFPHMLRGPQAAWSQRLGEVRRYRFVIEHRRSKQFLGIGLIQQAQAERTWEFGYAILPEHRRQGYASEVVAGLLRFLKETNPHGQVCLHLLSENLPSRAILRRAGFFERTLDATHTQCIFEY